MLKPQHEILRDTICTENSAWHDALLPTISQPCCKSSSPTLQQFHDAALSLHLHLLWTPSKLIILASFLKSLQLRLARLYTMLCDKCLALVTKLVQLRKEGRSSGNFALRELMQAATSLNAEEQAEDCYICNEWRKWQGKSYTQPLHSLEDMEVGFEENPRLMVRDLQFRFYREEDTSHNFLFQQEDHAVFEKAARSRLSLSTGSEECLELATHWFENCRENHQKCNARLNSGWYPRRLLDVSESKLRLIVTSERRPDGPYATMSHCWGRDKFLILTAENMEDFVSGIPLSSFLQSFRDAITVVRYLGLRYIWIDSYCIVQDSESGSHKAEKLLDIAQMRSVYTNSILNIGSSHADSPHGGCFSSRQKHAPTPEYFTLPGPSGQQDSRKFHLYTHADANLDTSRLMIHQLFQRAWVFQERILSPRMLHFGRGHLYYECQEPPLLSETFPSGHSFADLDETFAFKLDLHDGLKKDASLDKWALAVEDYSRMQLSHPVEDKFVAIAGIAQLVAEFAEDEYVAGFLRNHLLFSLGWKTYADSKRSTAWRAPTWSWASVEEDMVYIRQTLEDSPRYTPLAHIREVNVELVDPTNPYGALTSGNLVIQGRLIETSYLEAQTAGRDRVHGQWDFSLPGGDNSYAEIAMDDPSLWPAWRTVGAPGMKPESVLCLRSEEPELYMLPLCIFFEPEQSTLTVQEVRAQDFINERWMKIFGLLLQKLSSNDYIRRGAIDNLYGNGDGKNLELLLREWDARQDEYITLF